MSSFLYFFSLSKSLIPNRIQFTFQYFVEFLVLLINFFTSLNIFEKSFKFICSYTLHISFLDNTIFFNPYLFLLNFFNFYPNLLRISILLQLWYFSSKPFNNLFPLINNIIPRLQYFIIGKSFYHVLKIKVWVDVYVVLRLANIYIQCYARFSSSKLLQLLIKGLDDGHNYFYPLYESIIMDIDYVIELIISFMAHNRIYQFMPQHPKISKLSISSIPQKTHTLSTPILALAQKQRQGGSCHAYEEFDPGAGQGES